MRKLPVKKFDEYDVVTRWRRVMIWRTGEVSKIKRRIRRRERHYFNQEAKEGKY